MFNNPLYSSGSTFMKPGLFSSLKSINWSTFLGNAQKTLGVINQAIPIVYQVKPIISNAKTVFKIANSLKNDNNMNKDTPTTVENVIKNTKSSINNSNKPIFYL